MRRIVTAIIGSALIIIASILLFVKKALPSRGLFTQFNTNIQVVQPVAKVTPQIQNSGTPSEVERFQTEILPVASNFFQIFDSLKSQGVILPFRLPITTNMLSNLHFSGGPSNTISVFNLGGHTHMACHIIKRDGKEYIGVNSFIRSGRDEEGIPRNFVQLTQDPVANERYIKMLTDKTQYPPRELKEVALLAQKCLVALSPENASQYPLNEMWQEERASVALPFYLFTFTKRVAPSIDPANLMRDEFMIGFKSTKDGLILDFYEDNSISFLAQKRGSK